MSHQPKEPQVGLGDTALPVARPFLDIVHHWAANVPGGPLLSRCRLRIFRNGSLGRAIEWAVLITELAEFDRAQVQRTGVAARTCLSEIADQVKSVYLARAPHEQISWFLHDRRQASKDRPLPHDQLQRVQFNVRTAGGRSIYLNFALLPVPPEELELAAGGLVEL